MARAPSHASSFSAGSLSGYPSAQFKKTPSFTTVSAEIHSNWFILPAGSTTRQTLCTTYKSEVHNEANPWTLFVRMAIGGAVADLMYLPDSEKWSGCPKDQPQNQAPGDSVDGLQFKLHKLCGNSSQRTSSSSCYNKALFCWYWQRKRSQGPSSHIEEEDHGSH